MPVLISQFIRFLGIGFLNTAADFAVFNLLASFFGIYRGIEIGILNAISFSFAVLHSYFWNKYWSFSETQNKTKLGENLGQFVIAAVIGAVLIVAVILGAKARIGFWFYGFMVGVLILGEILLWKFLGLKKAKLVAKLNKQFFLFILVTFVGVLLNSLVVTAITSLVPPKFGLNQEFWANLAKAAATGVSLVWNFAGYKLFVFKK